MYILLRYKNILIAGAIVALALFFANNIYSGYQRDKRLLKEQKEKTEKRIEWSRKIEEVERTLNDTEAKLLGGDVFYFNRIIEDVAVKTNVKIESVKPGIRKETDEFNKAEASIRVTGDYKTIIRFIEELEKTKVVEIEFIRRNTEMVGTRSTYSIDLTGLLSREK